MDSVFVLVLAAITSVAVAAIEAPRHARPAAALRAAAGKALEAIGLTVAFFLVNVATGAAVAVAVRTLRVGFVSVYLSSDLSLLVLSLLQALVFQRWREARLGPS
jgi:hypothetical protein